MYLRVLKGLGKKVFVLQGQIKVKVGLEKVYMSYSNVSPDNCWTWVPEAGLYSTTRGTPMSTIKGS